jgi:hypothetical protein
LSWLVDLSDTGTLRSETMNRTSCRRSAALSASANTISSSNTSKRCKARLCTGAHILNSAARLCLRGIRWWQGGMCGCVLPPPRPTFRFAASSGHVPVFYSLLTRLTCGRPCRGIHPSPSASFVPYLNRRRLHHSAMTTITIPPASKTAVSSPMGTSLKP